MRIVSGKIPKGYIILKSAEDLNLKSKQKKQKIGDVFCSSCKSIVDKNAKIYRLILRGNHVFTTILYVILTNIIALPNT